MQITKNSILYFSGTGNTYEIVEKIANACGLDIINIANLREETVIEIECEILGLACPVYYGGVPTLMYDSLRRLEGRNGTYVFSVATYGGMPANPLGIVDRALEHKNMKLNSGFLLRMPGNYVASYGARKDSIQKRDFAKANQKMQEIIEIVRMRKVVAYEQSPYLIDRPFSVFSQNRVKELASRDDHFTVDTNKCNDCGICMKICPVQNITEEKGSKKWSGRCEQCMACIQYCPKEAIQYGNKTVKRKRYRNPNVDYLKVRLNGR